MATKKRSESEEALARPEPQEIARVPEIVQMVIVQPGTQDFDAIVMPDYLKAEEWEEAPSFVTPMLRFDPEQCPSIFRGEFIGLRELSLGGRTQRIYRFRLASGDEVGAWGSTVLDDRMFRLNPSVGDDVTLVYLGDTDTSRGLNPAKVFRVWKRHTERSAV